MLIVRVHPEILRSEGLGDGALDEKTVWASRFHSIVELEKHLHRNGTRIVKFYLHLSKDEQRKRFLQRIDEPNKNWKFSLADIEERKFWKRYMSAFEECLSATSTREAGGRPCRWCSILDGRPSQGCINSSQIESLGGGKAEASNAPTATPQTAGLRSPSQKRVVPQFGQK